MSAFIKNVLIRGTVILTMLLILGSFWLMSRKFKEDAVLEEFELDYIKYSRIPNTMTAAHWSNTTSTIWPVCILSLINFPKPLLAEK